MSNLSTLGRNAELSAISTLLAGGYFELRTGTQPTSVEDSATGTLIGTVTLNNPALGTPSGGAAALDPPVVVNATADADVNHITWGRFYTASNGAVLDASITIAGGGGEIIATKVDPLAGESIALTFTWTIPEHP